MTSSTLTSKQLFNSTATAVCEPAVNNTSTTGERLVGSDHQPLRKLPYQEDLQLQLIDLQAETEALLQQLQTLKQQRSTDQ